MLAMKVVYHQYAQEMLSVSRCITGNVQDSEEVIQNAFLHSFERIDQLKEAVKYRAWLKKSVINHSLTKTKQRWSPMDLPALDQLEAEDSNEDCFGEISIEKIRQAIFELPQGCRQILLLFLFENYKHREIASLLGISESTSKSQYRYALKILRTNISKFYQ